MKEAVLPKARSTSVMFGFLGLLLLMGALVIDSSVHWRGVSLNSAELRKTYRQRDDLLDELRTSIYRSNTLMRDYLLESDLGLANKYGAELAALHQRCNLLYDQYEKLVLVGERDGVQQLRQNSEAYWRYIEPALAWPTAQRVESGESYLKESIIPRRDQLIKLVNHVNQINAQDVDSGEDRIQKLNSDFQHRVVNISILAFILSIALACFVVLHVRRLENDVNRRFEELRAARLDLSMLSDRLVNAQEVERRNISRELHDDIGQSMSAMLMEVSQLESYLGATNRWHESFRAIRALAKSSIGKIRDLSLALRPAMLDEIGLVPALRWQVREVSRRTGLKVSLIGDESDEDLPDAYKTCIYRVVQESLHNCVKHSKASQVRIVMDRQGDRLSLSIEDNGVGFDPKHEQGLGLLGIAERVGKLGGRFQIESTPGLGVLASIQFDVSTVGEGVA